MKWLKQQLRKPIQEKRRLLSPSFQEHAASCVAHCLFEKSYYQTAQHIALYHSVEGEMSTALVLKHALSQKKCCYLPVLHNERVLQFVQYNEATPLFPNRFGILEPYSTKKIDPQWLDLVILPLVAFDSHCRRLGMGGGYYDATFSTKAATKPWLVGFAYDFQRVPEIPHTDLDVSLDEIITEKQFYCNPLSH